MTTAGIASIYPKEARAKPLDSPLKHCRRRCYIVNALSLGNCSSDLAKYLGCHCEECNHRYCFSKQN